MIKSRLLAVTLVAALILSGCASSQGMPAAVPSITPIISTSPATTPPAPVLSVPAIVPSPTSTVVPTPTTPKPVATSTASASPSPSPSSAPFVFPTAVYTPAVAPFKPTGALADMFQYTLGLINQDRQSNGLKPVVLSYNAAAQKHAQDMFDNYFMAHWGTDGLKPYMRYTLEGGFNSEQENSAYSGWFNKADNPNNYTPLDVKAEIKAIEADMMAELPPNDGHRRAILNKMSTKVNLGIVYDGKRLALAHQFENENVEFSQPPTLSGNLLSLSGRFTQPITELNNISISYDPSPLLLNQDQLNNGPHNYSLGASVGNILPPPPPGSFYSTLPANAIMATQWELNPAGQFAIQADISPALARGKGVYTVVIVVKMGNEFVNLTNYSIFVK